MNRFRAILFSFPALVLAATMSAEEPVAIPSAETSITIPASGDAGKPALDEALNRAKADYAERLRIAGDKLNQARETIAREKAPLLTALREADDRVVAAQTETARLEALQESAADTKTKLGREADGYRKGDAFLRTLAQDGLAAYRDGMLPGEKDAFTSRVDALWAATSDHDRPVAEKGAADVAAFLFERVDSTLGGERLPGASLIEGDNHLETGAFALLGPEVFFRADRDGRAGTVRWREGSDHPVTHPVATWTTASSAALFDGKLSEIPADASGGRALRLVEAKGTLWEHINKGGVVSYAILCVGAIAVLIALMKLRDLARFGVNSPAEIERCLQVMVTGNPTEADHAVASLKPACREILAAAARHAGKSRARLEEHLQAVLLAQRLQLERRLPLLAVIATAAPLMGLLGTVTGMVRTFALITVFGTGNAAKLASGISEVLVATELGLMVAIPSLVVHGFLAHRVQKNLGLLERYAVLAMAELQPDPAPEEAAT
ncbi:MAG TPA: MotA/TolQ/ExbB proton channel family protein [Candidatus Didemnitutus sp.]|nr:MotA/TolQ/ExbB proton channel family protein [Candidatus Didemnitutus sp.]